MEVIFSSYSSYSSWDGRDNLVGAVNAHNPYSYWLNCLLTSSGNEYSLVQAVSELLLENQNLGCIRFSPECSHIFFPSLALLMGAFGLDYLQSSLSLPESLFDSFYMKFWVLIIPKETKFVTDFVQ